MLRAIVATLSVPLLLAHGAGFAGGVSGPVGLSASNSASGGGRASQTITITNSNVTAGTGIRLNNTGGTQNVTIQNNRINAETGVLMNSNNRSQTVRVNRNEFRNFSKKVDNQGSGVFCLDDECDSFP